MSYCKAPPPERPRIAVNALDSVIDFLNYIKHPNRAAVWSSADEPQTSALPECQLPLNKFEAHTR